MSEYSDMTAGYRDPSDKQNKTANALEALFKDAKPCPARQWKNACPYPSVCRDKECCVDGNESLQSYIQKLKAALSVACTKLRDSEPALVKEVEKLLVSSIGRSA